MIVESPAKGHLFVALDTNLLNSNQIDQLRRHYRTVIIVNNRQNAITEMLAEDPSPTALLIGVREKISREVLDSLPNLVVIASASVGTDHIDLEEAKERGVEVVYAKGINARSVAEHTLALTLAQVKRIPEGNAAVLNGVDRAGLKELPRELRGQRFSVLGAGPTAAELVRLLVPFEVDLRIWTRNPDRHRELEAWGARFDSLREVVQGAEILSLHLALTPETRGMVTSDMLTALAPGGIIVNVSRRELLEEECAARLRENRPDIRFALDDFNLAASGTVATLDGSAIFTPHVAGVTREASRALIDYAISELIHS